MATYTLTTNGDNIIGTAANDTFNGTYDAAVTDTFDANDSLNGGTGIDTLNIDHDLDVAITPPDNLWTNLSNIENVVINTTGNGAQTLTTGANFETAFAPLGVKLTTTTSGAGAINIAMTTFTGAATLETTSTAGAQNIVTGSGATTVTAMSGAGALNIKGVGLNTVFATTTGAGEQTIGDGSGNGENLALVMATSNGGAQTITSTNTSAVVVEATSAAGQQIITTGSGADIITASTTSATNTIDTGADNDTVNISATTSGSYTVNGGTGNDTLISGAGNDTLIGGLGNDILNGGAGFDSMMGGDGSDVYSINIPTDVVTETNALISTGGIDTVNSSLAAYTLGANLENLTLTGTANIIGVGNTGNNLIIGNTGNNSLDGGTGNDTLNGATGNDTLKGGTGNDTYIVDSTTDVVQETGTINTEIDTVQTNINYTLGGNVENLILTGTNNIVGIGNNRHNTIIGNNGNNTFNGGAGNDTLTGGTGNDSFRFNTGAAFNTTSIREDTITDFTLNSDKIVLSKTTFTAISSNVGTGFSNASDFAIVTTLAGVQSSTAVIVYNSLSDRVFYNQNGADAGLGTGAAFAGLLGNPNLSASDFSIIA